MEDGPVQKGHAFYVGDWRVDPLRLVVEDGTGVEHSLAGKAMAVLVALARADGEVVQKYDLMQAVWGKADVSDGALFQAIFELRQVFGDDSKQARFIETIRGVGFRLLPPVRRCTSKGAPTERKQGVSVRKWGLVGALVLVLILVVGLVLVPRSSQDDPNADVRDKSIAVLPFADRGGFEENPYFIDGIHDDLLSQISRVTDIRTISRSTVMAYRDTNKGVRTIGEELGVSTLLKGGVQRAGDQVRVNVQLIDVESDTNLWARSYTRTFSAANVFAIQAEITADVADSLRSILTAEDEALLSRIPTESLDALDAFFRGMEARSRATDEGFREGVAHFERAVEIDSDFALAQAQLAMSLLLQVYFSNLPVDRQVRLAQPHIERALALDPRLSESYVAQGFLHELQREYGLAETAYEAALALNPNSLLALRSYGSFLNWNLGQPAEALQYLERALKIAPGSEGIRQQLAEALIAAGELERGEAIIRSVLAENPAHALTQQSFGLYLVWHRGETAEGIEAFRAALRADPGNPARAVLVAYAYETLGDRERFEAWLEHALSIAPDSKDEPAIRALIAESGGDLEGATEAMARVPIESALFIDLQLRLAWNTHLLGDTKDALDRIFGVHPEFLAEPPEIGRLHLGEAAYASYFLYLLGDREAAERLARAVLEAAARLPRTGRFGRYWWPAFAHLVLEDHPRTVEALRSYLDEGPFDAFLVESPIWDPLRDDEGYQSLRDEVLRRIAREQKKLAEMDLGIPGASEVRR